MYDAFELNNMVSYNQTKIIFEIIYNINLYKFIRFNIILS